MSLKETLFKSNKSKTFENEESLPPLPVPPLTSTLDTYLDSVRAISTDEEYNTTEAIVRNFENGIGAQLQELLLKRAQNHKNWLSEWWLDYAYLMQRSPLIPYSNFAGTQQNFDFWPLKLGTRIQRIALLSFYNIEFWQLLRKEQLKATKIRGTLWSMQQFKNIFNSCRIPGELKDTLITNFKTEFEGPAAPTNVIVLYKGYIFTFDALFNDQPLTAPEFESQLSYIENWCKQQPKSGPGVGALTTTDRTKWALNRKHLKSLSSRNEEILNAIENSLTVLAFDDKEPQTQIEICRESLLGNCEDRWADKSLTNIAYINGNFGAIAEHTPFDALALAILSQYINISLFESKGQYNGSKQLRILPKPTLLDFQIDEKIVDEIESAKLSYREACDRIEILHEIFTDYGRSVSAKHRIHPEAYIQIAIQLAYYRTHGKPATTYCTATTRRFYHGRTETCRACTPESVQFAKAVIDGNTPINDLFVLLQKAGQKFQQLMANACKGLGCDRHFLGLYITALENGFDIPEIFTDPSFIKTGGNGSYVLSTSCAGYWKSCGGLPPMVENGYSCFYGIENHQYSFNVSNFKSCSETNAELFYKNIRLSLLEMQKILDFEKSDITLQHNL